MIALKVFRNVCFSLYKELQEVMKYFLLRVHDKTESEKILPNDLLMKIYGFHFAGFY